MKKNLQVIGRVRNAARPNNVVTRQDLTEYAYGLTQEIDPIMRVAGLFAPIVPTGVTDGRYNKFDDTQHFKAYANARRSMGGQANSIAFLNDTGSFACEPYGLRIAIDQHERSRAGETAQMALLERAKTRTLTVTCGLSYLNDVITTVKASVSAAAGKGSWQDAAKDPIAEINDQFKKVYLATGMVPNTVVFDFGAWCVFSQHPKVLARMPGADLASASPERVAKLLVNPSAKIEIVETAILTGGGLGNTSATKVGILGGSVFVMFNSPAATQYDPSFCKTFTPAQKLFTEVYSYREEPHLDWYENNWTLQIAVVASTLCARIDVTGATSN